MNGNLKKQRKPWSPESRAKQALIATAQWAKRRALKDAPAVDRDEANCASRSAPAAPLEMSQSEVPVLAPDGVLEQSAGSLNNPEQIESSVADSPDDALDPPLGPLCNEEVLAETKAADLKLGQLVYCPKFGHGRVAAIDGDTATVRAKDSKGAIEDFSIAIALLVTLTQAKVVCHAWWLRGKEWRLVIGKWLWIVRELCRHGEWKAFREEYKFAKSSAYDLIHQYEKEVGRTLQARRLVEKNLSGGEKSEIRTFGQETIISDGNINESTPAPENDERTENPKSEPAKSGDIKSTRSKTTLRVVRRHLDPGKLALYDEVEAVAKKLVDEIMCRKIDEGVEEVIALAPVVLAPRPASVPATATEYAVAGNSAPAKRGALETGAPPAPRLSPVDAEIVARVRAHLRKQGVKKPVLGAIKWVPGLTYTEQYHAALKQLPD
jgi:hypothetical protein